MSAAVHVQVLIHKLDLEVPLPALLAGLVAVPVSLQCFVLA